jgi:phosphodiesterase/alkaline phosphatase D-like protein
MNILKCLAKWLAAKEYQPTPIELLVEMEFKSRNAGIKARARMVADEESRYVVRVEYSGMRPPRLAFYSVEKATNVVAPLDDDSAYPPKVWR